MKKNGHHPVRFYVAFLTFTLGGYDGFYGPNRDLPDAHPYRGDRAEQARLQTVN